jgi:hypothetical protein
VVYLFLVKLNNPDLMFLANLGRIFMVVHEWRTTDECGTKVLRRSTTSSGV